MKTLSTGATLIAFCVIVGTIVGLMQILFPVARQTAPSASSSEGSKAAIPSAQESANVAKKVKETPQDSSDRETNAAHLKVSLQGDEDKWADFIAKQNEQWMYLRNDDGVPILQFDGGRSISPTGKRYRSLIREAESQGIYYSLRKHDFAMEKLEGVMRALSASTPNQPPFVTNRRDRRAYPHIEGQRVAIFTSGRQCLELAQTILIANKLTEVKFSEANLALVVVRGNSDPEMLRYYASAAQLRRESVRSLNDSGFNGYVFVYHLRHDVRGSRFETRASQLFHESLEWSDFELGS